MQNEIRTKRLENVNNCDWCQRPFNLFYNKKHVVNLRSGGQLVVCKRCEDSLKCQKWLATFPKEEIR